MSDGGGESDLVTRTRAEAVAPALVTASSHRDTIQRIAVGWAGRSVRTAAVQSGMVYEKRTGRATEQTDRRTHGRKPATVESSADVYTVRPANAE